MPNALPRPSSLVNTRKTGTHGSTKPTHEISDLLQPVHQIKKLRFRVSKQTKQFLDYLSHLGRFRYLEVSYHANGGSLVSLDRAVWEIRRYCAVLDESVEHSDGTVFCTLEHELDRIERSNDKPEAFRWFRRELERILENRTHPARPALVWRNFYFAARMRNSIRLSNWHMGVNASLPLNRDLFQEVRKYVFFQSP